MGLSPREPFNLPRGGRGRSRASGGALAARAFLLVLLTAGCAVLWIGIPVGGMWAASKLTEDAATHFLIALCLVPAAMIAWARGLFWVNRLYVRVGLGTQAVEVDPEEREAGIERWLRGPLEPLLVATLLLALAALFAWFFLLAENPSMQVI